MRAIVFCPSALALLVARVLTNDSHDALAANHLTLLTDLFDARSYFHDADSRRGVVSRGLLFGYLGNLTPTRVVLGENNQDLILGQDSNDGVAELGTYVGRDDLPVRETDSIERFGTNLDDGSSEFVCHV
jgi:hypothetical protein